MKRIYSYLKSVIYFSLFTLSFFTSSAQAQDAFYIYRNDGDFNGFFFDEVISMSYSKVDPQGVEHEEYVIQEIETADSLYRIPLCVIDSIGFQQPEIKINPRVRIIERCGLKQYMGWVKNSDDQVVVDFHDVPENLKPKVGDVLIYLCTDDEYLPFIYTERGFSCIVDKVQTFDNITNVEGHYVTDPGEVFEQFITVEDVTVDPEGNVRRRLAGWHPEKAPRRAETPELTLVDFDFTVGREWEPTNNSKIAIEAKLGVKFKLRATYDIGWTRFYAKLTRTLTTSVEPAVTIGYKGDFMKELEDLVELPPIIFPAACPVFGINPYPTLFLHAWGEFETKLTLPKAELNIAEDIIFDTGRLFPIGYSMYPVPSEDTSDEPIFDVGNTSVKLAGHVQAGVKVGCDVGTAKWMQKIIKGNVGFYAYIGPQVDGQIEFQTDWLNNDEMNLYDILRRAEVDVSLLSVNVEAKATARALWGEEQHKTFLTKDWKFLCDTSYLVPRFQKSIETTYHETDPTIIKFEMFPGSYHLLNFNELEFGIYEAPEFADYTNKDMIQKLRVGKTTYYGVKGAKYRYTLSNSEFECLKGGRGYTVVPLVTWLGHGPYPAWAFEDIFICPCTMSYDKDYVIQFSRDGGEASIEFQTNCEKERIVLMDGYDWQSSEPWVESVKVEVVNEQEGRYKAVFKAERNKELWGREALTDPSLNELRIEFSALYPGNSHERYNFPLKASQELSDLNYLRINCGVWFETEVGTGVCRYSGKVTATRTDENTIDVTGSYTEDLSFGKKCEHTISCVLHKIPNPYREAKGQKGSYTYKVTNGVIKQTSIDSGYKTVESATFEIGRRNDSSQLGHVTSGSVTHMRWDGVSTFTPYETGTMVSGENGAYLDATLD